MTTFHDVPADLLISDLSQRLADNDAISAPEWAEFVKTGTHRERPPTPVSYTHLTLPTKA